jgi:hypothetical protein
MKIKGCTDCCCIDDGLWSLCFNVEDVEEEYIEKAKEEDGESFWDRCFELQVYFQEKRDYCETYITCSLIYVTNEGSDLEFNYELTGEQELELFMLIRKEI